MLTPTPFDILSSQCRDALEVVIVAPYMKSDALRRILSVVSGDASITCVTRWAPADIMVGASDTACRSLVLNRGGTFRLHPSLHAKFYR